MKILLLTTHLNFGGISGYTLALARKLKEAGDIPVVASSGGALVPLLEKEGIAHVRVGLNTKSELSIKVWLAAFKLASFVKQEGVNIIHAQTRVAQVSSCIISKLTKIPFVSTCHGFFKPKLGRRLFGCWGERVIAISEAVRGHLVNDFDINKKGISLIYNGIEIDKFKEPKSIQEIENFKGNAGVSKDDIVIGIIGRLSSVKGHQFLLKAVKEVIQYNKNIKLLIIGEGPEKKHLLRLTRDLGIEEYVVFLKSILDTSLALKSFDIFVMPSIQEGLGLSILEAMASGLPVVASNVGGIYSLIKDGLNGFLLPPKNSTAISKAIITLIEEPKLARQMGVEGQRIASEQFCLDEMVRHTRNLYMEVLSEN